ncbi:MAG: hypothetical protein AB1797_13995, partial [bacterium]
EINIPISTEISTLIYQGDANKTTYRILTALAVSKAQPNRTGRKVGKFLGNRTIKEVERGRKEAERLKLA